jgi:hypothetical protein
MLAESFIVILRSSKQLLGWSLKIDTNASFRIPSNSLFNNLTVLLYMTYAAVRAQLNIPKNISLKQSVDTKSSTGYQEKYLQI